ncbi:undecaprenyl-phosphate galactose phosphotransferase WbaP [Deinococcus daejeonensis]|nr:undecaprenyl-phosphate galactose phosphotransferase WbaP [Deinococcus daejeonensis]
MGVLTPPGLHSKSIAVLPVISSFPQGAALLFGDALSFLCTYGLAQLVLPTWGLPVEGLHPFLVWGAVWLCWRAYQGLYPGYGRSPQTELRLHVTGTVQVVAVQLAAGLALQRISPSVTGTVLCWVTLLILSLFVRYGCRTLMIRAGYFGRPVSVIGAGQTAALAIQHLRAHPAYGLNPVAAYDDNEQLHGTTLHGVPILGTIEQAITDPQTEQALVSIPGARAETQQRVVNATYAVFPHTWVIPDLFGIPNQALQPHNIGSVASLEVRNNLRSVQSRFIKRTIDLLGAGLGGLFLLPILLLIALAIKLDSPGPAVYRARRLGRNGEPFDCFKFRSMHRDAEAKLNSVLDSNPALKAEFEATHKLKDDPRVTRVGAFLRKTSLDEFPQLANVLLGTMSLVGPRPIVQGEVPKYGDIYAVYKQVRPGMTGYWQANGRSDTSYDERVGMDNFYVTNWTPWLDMVVLIQTIRVVFAGKGAY